ncbi:hypothetical protein GW17_00059155 [Ensete ventricosum]|nr:hypothetical protein GW17_00059155 [Ensete ventricosum]
MPHYPSSGLQSRIHRAKYLSGRLGSRFVLPPSPHYRGLPQMVEDIPESGDAPHGATSLHFSTNAEERALSLVGHYFFTCFRLCKNRGGYYLTARAGFKVSGAPTNNKGWKARYIRDTGDMDLLALREMPKVSGGRTTTVGQAPRSSPEVKEVCVEATPKRPANTSVLE